MTLALTTGAVVHAVPASENIRLNCWDGTFWYNHVDIKSARGQIDFRITGRARFYRHLLNSSNDLEDAEITFGIPTSSCVSVESDSTTLSCYVSSLEITGKSENRTEGTTAVKTSDLSEVEVQLLRVKNVTGTEGHLLHVAMWGERASLSMLYGCSDESSGGGKTSP